MRLLCFGDSNTYGYDPRAYLADRYPAEVRWTDRLARTTGWEVCNLGQNGREIPDAAPAFPLYDWLVVMLGSNDLLRPQTTAAGVSARMERFLRGLPRVLLVAPPPMRPGAWVTEERLLTESTALAGHYQALARRLSCSFADAGQWGVELAYDGVHFSEEGHRTFAGALRLTLGSLASRDSRSLMRRASAATGPQTISPCGGSHG